MNKYINLEALNSPLVSLDKVGKELGIKNIHAKVKCEKYRHFSKEERDRLEIYLLNFVNELGIISSDKCYQEIIKIKNRTDGKFKVKI